MEHDDPIRKIRSSKELSDHFKGMFKAAIKDILEAELEEHLGYQKYEHEGKSKSNSRNGTNSKKLKSQLGEIDLEVPRDRNSTFEPQLVKKRQTVLDDVEQTVVGLYSRGMTVRDITDQINEMYGVKLSESLISRITNKLLPTISEWQHRPLEELYVLMWLDAMFFKIKSDGKIVNKALYLVMGLNVEGKKDVLGMWIAESESASFWLSVLKDIQARGVKDVLIASIDNLNGFDKAIASIYPKTTIQTCVVHQIRNNLKFVVWKDRKQFTKRLRDIYGATNIDQAQEALYLFEKEWGSKYPVAVKSWKANWENLTAFFDFPCEVRKIMYTTNIIESLNSNIRKVTRGKKIFPHDQAVLKSVYLGIQQAQTRWTMPIHNWPLILQQLVIMFPDRLGIEM
jgi:transposase-like protein